jgi:hypothetical protein
MLEKINDKVTIMYKYNASDPDWLGDEEVKPINLMLETVKFKKNSIQESRPKDVPPEYLNNIDLSIEACSDKIITMMGEEEGSAAIEDLKNEAWKLRNPESNRFHWDTSIYDADANESDDWDSEEDNYNAEHYDEDNANDNNDMDVSENVDDSASIEIDDGRNSAYNTSVKFSVGRRQKNQIPTVFEYEVGDFVVMPQGFLYIFYFLQNIIDDENGTCAPFLIAQLLELVKAKNPKNGKCGIMLRNKRHTCSTDMGDLGQ